MNIHNLDLWKKRLLYWSAANPVCLYLDSNGRRDPLVNGHWELLVGVGAVETLALSAGAGFEAIKKALAATPDWWMGGFGYDLKNEVENLSSRHTDNIEFPDLVFFRPETVVGIRDGMLEIHTRSKPPELVLEELERIDINPDNQFITNIPGDLTPRIPKAEYLEKVQSIRQRIVEGDLYEMNFCQEFFAENAVLDPVAVWEKLTRLSRAPMSAFFRWQEQYLLSASPERFLKKEGQKLISQPIKGTRRRAGLHDQAMREELAASEKDRAENIMIVDLVRNDLARSCAPGSVRVEELFGIHTFQTVHQMISTVSGQLRPEINAVDALRAAFPPGSMTGAPKVMSMDLIEEYERTRRGLYAGAVGYFAPDGDFDFNVVIRSIFYHAGRQNVSLQVGGAIVFDSSPEAEYEECLLKARAMFEALGKA